MAWLAVLKAPMAPLTHKRVLLRLPEHIMPYLPNPLKLSDFLTDSFDLGGLTSTLALSSLFILMRLHQLEYPTFYERLYNCLEPSIFFAKHRARFFRLLTLCLSTGNIPSYVTAAFVKKMNRLALAAPPSGSLYVVALTKKLLQKNSELMPLIRKSASSGPHDGFNPSSSDLQQCCALDSSLWELQGFKSHYHPAVSTLCMDVERKWDKHEPTVRMEEYSAHTYRDLFDLEVQRKTKKTPLCFKKPSGLYAGDLLEGLFD